MSKDEVREIALTGTRLVKEYTSKHPETSWRYEYSPAVFSTTEPEFAMEVCNAVTAVWQPTTESKVTIGRASCREGECQYVSISVVAVSLKTKQRPQERPEQEG